MVKIVFLGNCQVSVYEKILLNSNLNSFSIKSIEIWRYKPEQFDTLYTEEIQYADIIVSQNLSYPYYKKLATKNLKENIKNLILIHNLYFRAFIPDCTYIGPMGKRYKSILGDYHSSLVFENWKSSNSIKTSIEEINNFSKINIKNILEQSSDEFSRREEEVNVHCSDLIFDFEQSYSYFHFFNHPNIELHTIYLKRILETLNIQNNLVLIDDPLLQHGVFPIYPAVESYFNVKTNRNKFIASSGIGGKEYTTEEFVKMSYLHYDKTVKGKIK